MQDSRRRELARATARQQPSQTRTPAGRPGARGVRRGPAAASAARRAARHGAGRAGGCGRAAARGGFAGRPARRDAWRAARRGRGAVCGGAVRAAWRRGCCRGREAEVSCVRSPRRDPLAQSPVRRCGHGARAGLRIRRRPRVAGRTTNAGCSAGTMPSCADGRAVQPRRGLQARDLDGQLVGGARQLGTLVLELAHREGLLGGQRVERDATEDAQRGQRPASARGSGRAARRGGDAQVGRARRGRGRRRRAAAATGPAARSCGQRGHLPLPPRRASRRRAAWPSGRGGWRRSRPRPGARRRA